MRSAFRPTKFTGVCNSINKSALATNCQTKLNKCRSDNNYMPNNKILTANTLSHNNKTQEIYVTEPILKIYFTKHEETVQVSVDSLLRFIKNGMSGQQGVSKQMSP